MTEGNPFPGLRPFEQHESALYFGRDEQCDDLLARLARRRLVAVVGMSGSGKSSLVRAGLLPALDRGYVPSAGSSWHVAIFRPGSDPLANLTRALAMRRRPGGAAAGETPDAIRALLDASSLGLVAAARQLLTEPGDSLLVVADQFEELFRFERIARGGAARDQAAACVDLLVNAAQQDEVPVYVVLTMRSDYLGDCAQFTGLPEALNDSQFLVPRMMRAELRAAIEYPVAVCGGRISPRLVQRLLYDVERLAAPAGGDHGPGDQRDQDQLPVLQHALMRVWSISHDERQRDEQIDLPHYENPPVETLAHALDRHAEEVYQGLPSDRHREAARLVFQQLTDRDAANRDVRRPTPLAELIAVVRNRVAGAAAGDEARLVNDVVTSFSGEARAFVVVNAQDDVDISHESLIRNWERLRAWLQQENRSRRVYTRLADAASNWRENSGSLYRGPELAEARRWWAEQKPTQPWASRYGNRFDHAAKFLAASTRSQHLRRGLLIGNVAILTAGAIAIAVLMAISRDHAQKAEAAALQARNAIEESRQRLTEANEFFEKALEAERQGKTAIAEEFARQAQNAQQQASSKPVLTPGELAELDRLRRAEKTWKETEADLRRQVSEQKPAPENTADRAELDRLRKAESAWQADRDQLKQEIATLTGRVTTLQQSDAALRKQIEDLLARPPAAAGDERPRIEQVLRDYQAAYETLNAAALVRIMPSQSLADVSKSFAQTRSYKMQIDNPVISLKGDSATVTATRTIAVQVKVGNSPAPSPPTPVVFSLERVQNVWVIVDVQRR